jgi:hypothetical protein
MRHLIIDGSLYCFWNTQLEIVEFEKKIIWMSCLLLPGLLEMMGIKSYSCIKIKVMLSLRKSSG